MKVKIKRFDKSVPLPAYKSPGAAAMDAYARESVTIGPHQIGYIPLNIAVELPKLGVMMINGIGIGDEDFRGDNDEYSYPAFNFTDKGVTIEKGTRMAQIMIMKGEKVEWQEAEKLENEDRGKYGSTGVK